MNTTAVPDLVDLESHEHDDIYARRALKVLAYLKSKKPSTPKRQERVVNKAVKMLMDGL